MSLTAIIKANIDDFQKNLDKAQARMDAFADTIGEKVAGIGRTMQAIGGAMSLAITAPLSAIGVAAFNMASDFEDALGATDQIFKQSSDGVKDWANNLETYFGISKKEALEYSNIMGSMLVNIGNLTEEQAGKQGAKLIELAGDLTAMYGGQTQDAVRALTGALKGNNTMLDNYGMAVNDALVKTRALELGLIRQGEEMSLSAKQAATLSLIYEQSSAAQGQAAREADGASGSMRALRTEITNLTTEIGAVLLPVVTPLINRLKDMVSAFRSLSPETQKMIVVIGGIAAAIGPALLGLGSLLKLAPLVGTAFAAMTGPIGIVVAAIAGAAVLITKNWDSIKAYFTTGSGGKLWDAISNAASELWKKLRTIFGAIRDFVIAVWEKIGSNVITQVRNAFNIVLSVVDIVITTITGIINTFSALLRGDFRGAINAVGDTFKGVFHNILRIGANVLSSISNQIAGFLKLMGADGLAGSLERFAERITPVTEAVKETGEAANDAAGAVTQKTNALNNVVPALQGATKATKDYRAEMVELFASWGIYEYQVQSLTSQFSGFTKNAKLAGASIAELDLIASRFATNKGLLALEQFDLSETRNIGSLGGLSQGLTIPAKIKVDADFSAMREKFKEVKATFEELTIDLSQVLTSGVSDLVSSVGDALATGGNVFDAIGQSLIKSLGNLAKSVGEQMIAFGVAGLALKNLMKNPILSIAAGAALVALGSLASASIGKQTSSFTGGYAATPSYGGGDQDYSQWRGALYNNEKQVVEVKLSGDNLRGWMDQNDIRKERVN